MEKSGILLSVAVLTCVITTFVAPSLPDARITSIRMGVSGMI